MAKIQDTQVQDSRLISPEVKLYIATAVSMVLKHLTEFKSLAEKYQYLKFPLRYIGGCDCSVGTAKMEKYILSLGDAAPTTEPVFSPKKGKLLPHKTANFNFNLGFISSAIYVVHRCLKTGNLKVNLCTSYNKLTPSGMGILQARSHRIISRNSDTLFTRSVGIFVTSE